MSKLKYKSSTGQSKDLKVKLSWLELHQLKLNREQLTGHKSKLFFNFPLPFRFESLLFHQSLIGLLMHSR